MAVSLYISPNPHSETRISLNNTIFYIIFKYSTREDSWYFTLLDVNKNVLHGGVKVTYGSVLTERLPNSVLAGNLYVVKNKDATESLGRFNFGQDLLYELVYLTTVEEEAIVSGIQS
jgi:hypothetical protein